MDSCMTMKSVDAILCVEGVKKESYDKEGFLWAYASKK